MDSVIAEDRKGAPGKVSDFLEEPQSLELFDYWCSKRAGRVLPSRQDIDPSEIRSLLTKIYLVDFEEPDVFRYRLAGTEIAETFGHGNLKGQTLGDLLSEQGRKFVTGRWRPVVKQELVVCMKGQVYNSVNRFAFGERILLPLADRDGGPATGLLGMTFSRWVDRIGPVERRNSDMATFRAADIP
ncbi:PAS domain-containing protein [Nisaea acidiphila]|uniref:PAS domain-containing protein n=1 Tax=Nisaea acidiphila TaxID=1862145 RepID=A0A9J7AV35_9PROT|nr:PAS domain-containing protein [Nisaea acidiphila]UUX50666.1 PAS domain-containing protein [Nisaea acidiphila]